MAHNEAIHVDLLTIYNPAVNTPRPAVKIINSGFSPRQYLYRTILYDPLNALLTHLK